MESEIKQLNRKVREAAKRSEEMDARKKETMKTSSIDMALNEKMALQKELNKKPGDYTAYYILAGSLLCIIFIIFMAYQMASLWPSGKNLWEKPITTAEDRGNLKTFITGCVANSKTPKKLKIASDIPGPWLKNIFENFKAFDNKNWQIAQISEDEFKKGANPLFEVILTNPSQILRVLVIKKNEGFMILKCATIKENKNETVKQ
jgi:hypothetical protein